MQANLSLDRTMLAYVLSNKHFAMEVTTKIGFEYFHVDIQWLYKAISDHFTNPKFKELPTENIIQEHLNDNYSDAKFVTKGLELFKEIKKIDVDSAEFTWHLDKFKRRYNEQVQRTCARSMVELIKKATPGEESVDKINQIMKESVVTIDGIYRKEAYSEGALSQSAKDRAKKYKEVESSPELAQGLQTGLTELDRISNGLHPGELLIIGGSTGCQPSGSKVLMSCGNWKNIEDVVVGDIVLSPQHDGSVVEEEVTETFVFHDRDIYEVFSKGRRQKISYKASHNHILPIIKPHTEKHVYVGNRLFEMTIDDYIRKSDNWKIQAKIFRTPAYDLPEKDFILPPYVVGVILGDGSTKYKPNVTSADVEIFNELEKLGVTLGKNIKQGSSCAVARNIIGNYSGIVKQVIGNATSEFKKIPDEYFCGSLTQRLELLAGLIDTDGTFEEFSSKSKYLADGFRDLILSVGGSASVNKRKTKCCGREFTSYRVHYSFGEFVAPVKLNRKISNKRNMNWKNPRVTGFDVKFNSNGTVYGFSLSGKTQWYITDDYIVTHNTGKSILMHNMAVNAYLGGLDPLAELTQEDMQAGGHNVLYFSLEMPKESQERRVDSCMSNVVANHIRDGRLDNEEKARYFKALKFQNMYRKQFHIVDMARGVTPREIELKYIELCDKYGIEFDGVFVDYIGIMKPDVDVRKNAADWLELGYVAEGLHEFARAYGVPVVTASQLTRTKDPNKSQISTDRFARSAMIPDNANVALQIACRGDDEHTRLDMPVHITKMRDGEKGSFTLIKDFARMKVTDMVDETFGDDDDEF